MATVARNVFLVVAISFVELSLPANPQEQARHLARENQASEQEHNSISSPDLILKQAMHFADLYNWSDAGPFFRRAEELYRSTGDERNTLYAHLGVIRSTMERLSLSEASEELGTMLDKNPLMQSDKELRLFCLCVKGDIDGEIDAAPMRRDWEEAFQIATVLRDQKWINRASAEIGFSMFLQGDLMSARQKVAAGVIGASMLHDVGGQIRYLASIGTSLVYLDSYDQGLGYLDRALRLAAENPDTGYPFLTQEGRLQAFRRMGKLDDAQQLADEVIHEASTRQKYVKQTQALITAAAIARARNEIGVAIHDLQLALDLAAKGGFRRLLAHAQFELADIYRVQGNTADAEELATTAAEATQQIGEMYLLPGRLQVLGDLQVAQRQYVEADATYDRASDILDSIIGNITAAPARLGVISAMSDLYVRHFSLLADHFHNTAKAHLVLERARSRAITDLLTSGDRRETPQDREIERTIGQLNLKLSSAKSAIEIRNIRDKIFFAEQGRWLTSRANSWKSAPISVESLQIVEQSLSPKEVVLEYVLAEPRSYCLVITHDAAHIVTLASRKQIEERVAAFLAKVKAKKEAGVEAARAYYVLLRNIPELTKESWIIVPDGRLHLIPFEALRDKTGRYIVYSHTITYAPRRLPSIWRRRSCSQIQWCRGCFWRSAEFTTNKQQI
jgi:tetratricopeptide (TPR) repeat protein